MLSKRKRERKMKTNTTRTKTDKLIQADKIIMDLLEMLNRKYLYPIDIAYRLMIMGNLGRDLYLLGFTNETIKHARAWVRITNPQERL